MHYFVVTPSGRQVAMPKAEAREFTRATSIGGLGCFWEARRDGSERVILVGKWPYPISAGPEKFRAANAPRA